MAFEFKMRDFEGWNTAKAASLGSDWMERQIAIAAGRGLIGYCPRLPRRRLTPKTGFQQN